MAFAVLAGAHALAEAAKLAADQALRQTMAEIRALVLDNFTLVSHRRLSPEGARKLAANLKDAVARLRARTELPQATLVALAGIIDPIDAGADAIAGRVTGRDAMDGMADIEAALSHYPEVFDDPEWKPLR